MSCEIKRSREFIKTYSTYVRRNHAILSRDLWRQNCRCLCWKRRICWSCPQESIELHEFNILLCSYCTCFTSYDAAMIWKQCNDHFSGGIPQLPWQPHFSPLPPTSCSNFWALPFKTHLAIAASHATATKMGSSSRALRIPPLPSMSWLLSKFHKSSPSDSVQGVKLPLSLMLMLHWHWHGLSIPSNSNGLREVVYQYTKGHQSTW